MSSRFRSPSRSTAAIFAWPLVIGMLSLAGLIAGLTGGGGRDVAAWALLGSTLVAISIAFWRAKDPASSASKSPRTESYINDLA